MGVTLSRKKARHPILSIAYKLKKILPFSNEKKLKLFLDLEWIFNRLAHEESFKIYPAAEHPARVHSKHFILSGISNDHYVLDLGCKHGEISNFIAEKAKEVIAIDHDYNAISKAKSTYKKKNLKFETGEAFDYLSNQNLKFDVLILSHILEHLDNPEDFLFKFKHFFQFIYIEVPDFQNSYLNEYRFDKNSKLIYTDNDHVSEFDRAELRELVQKCGLTIQKEEYRFGVQKIWCNVVLN